ncbi:MAG TPA: hypothetical protein VGL59_22570 [Polyangia bacterium]|jgi:RNA polymerase sigma-70 factor (ECF subfamily)
MPDLATVFRQAAPPAEHPLTAALAASPALEQQLTRACARGRAAFHALVLDDETFVRHLARCLSRIDDATPSLDQLAIEDLYLACACLTGVAGAAAAFDDHCGAPIRAALASVSSRAVDRDEIEQQLRIHLLIGSDENPPRLNSYLGLGPLARWAGVAAQRLAVSALRSDQSEASARERSAVEAAFDWKDPAILLLKERYRADFQRALEDALALISDRDRVLLRMHLVNEMTTRSIGKVYNVDHSTAARWLTDARQEIADHIQRLLRERLNLSPSEVQSIATLMTSQLELSISLLLKP